MTIAGFTLQENDKHELFAQFVAQPETQAVSLQDIQAEIAAGGFADLALDDKATTACASQISHNQPFGLMIGRRCDASYRIELSADKMSATLTVLAEQGGTPPSVEYAQAALALDKIVFGVSVEKLLMATSQPGSRVEVATGIAPAPGKDGWFEPLIESNRQRHPHVGADGHIDFRDLGGIPSALAGQPVLRRHPPETGKPGRNVLGEPVPAGDGKDIQFAIRLQGVERDPADPNLLRAIIAGQPILQRDGVTIEPILKLDKVDISTGNVDFPGSVEVRGDVQSGMKIKAGGDVNISGTVESAEIVAGGDVLVRAGIIGHEAQGKPDSKKENTAIVHAEGNIKARYVENAVLQAGQSVFVDEALISCDVMAIDHVVVGDGKSGKGHIMGGFIRATTGIKTDQLGSAGSGQTRVFAGVNPLIQHALDAAKARLSNKLKEHAEMTKVGKLLASRPDKKEMFEKAKATVKKFSEEIAEIMDDERRLTAELQLADKAEIVVTRKIHAGSMVAIGKKSRFVGEDREATTFRIAGSELVGS